MTTLMTMHEISFGGAVCRLRPRSLLTQELYNRFLREWHDFATAYRLALAPALAEDDKDYTPRFVDEIDYVKATLSELDIDFEFFEWLIFFVIHQSPRVHSVVNSDLSYWKQTDTLRAKLEKFKHFLLSESIDLLEAISAAIFEMDKPADIELAPNDNGLDAGQKKED